MIIDKLIEKIKETKCPVCVGLDPQPSFIPKQIKERYKKEYGTSITAEVMSILEYNKQLIDSFYDIVPSVKPQIAFYERYGWEGIKAYTETIAYAKSKGLIVIGDVKRGDIASTAEGYSDGHLGEIELEGCKIKPFDSDFITVNPYLGKDSIEPFFANMEKYNKGIFALVKTSNPGSIDIQDIESTNGEKIYEVVGRLVNKWGEKFIGSYGYSSVGAVVGATWPEQAKRLRKIMPNIFFLIPGYGAQGGKAEDIAVCFDRNGLGGIVNSSRGIIAAWKKGEYIDKLGAEEAEEKFAECARNEVMKMKEDLGRHIYEQQS